MTNDDKSAAAGAPRVTEQPLSDDQYGTPLDGYAGVPPSLHDTSETDESDGPMPVTPAGANRTVGRAVREIVETLILAVLIFVAVRALVLNFRVDGNSMVPNLHDREMLLVNRNVYFHFDLNALLDALPGIEREGERIVYVFHPPERGDIIVFTPPLLSEKPYIKRVIGLPGETVEIRQDGYVYINGQRLEEPYIQGGITDCSRQQCVWEIPDQHVFVLGDNRRNSSDSRIFGPVPIDSIIGKAWLTYWPPDDFGLVPHYDYPEIQD